MTKAEAMEKVVQTLMMDHAFQRTLQRYHRDDGSSGAIAQAAFESVIESVQNPEIFIALGLDVL